MFGMLDKASTGESGLKIELHEARVFTAELKMKHRMDL